MLQRAQHLPPDSTRTVKPRYQEAEEDRPQAVFIMRWSAPRLLHATSGPRRNLRTRPIHWCIIMELVDRRNVDAHLLVIPTVMRVQFCDEMRIGTTANASKVVNGGLRTFVAAQKTAMISVRRSRFRSPRTVPFAATGVRSTHRPSHVFPSSSPSPVACTSTGYLNAEFPLVNTEHHPEFPVVLGSKKTQL